jgi:hypothetical protein
MGVFGKSRLEEEGPGAQAPGFRSRLSYGVEVGADRLGREVGRMPSSSLALEDQKTEGSPHPGVPLQGAWVKCFRKES